MKLAHDVFMLKKLQRFLYSNNMPWTSNMIFNGSWGATFGTLVPAQDAQAYLVMEGLWSLPWAACRPARRQKRRWCPCLVTRQWCAVAWPHIPSSVYSSLMLVPSVLKSQNKLWALAQLQLDCNWSELGVAGEGHENALVQDPLALSITDTRRPGLRNVDMLGLCCRPRIVYL